MLEDGAGRVGEGEPWRRVPVVGAEDPGPGLLDGELVFAGDLELDLHGEPVASIGLVQLLELRVDDLEMLA